MSRRHPVRRVVIALIAAAMAAAWPSYLIALFALPAGLAAALWFVALGLGIALAHAVFLGLPFYMLIARRGPPWLRVTTIAGGVVGALPIPSLMMITGEKAVILPALYFAFCGMVGGAVFDVVLTRLGDRT